MTTPSVATPLSRFMLLFSVLYLSFGAASPFLPAFLKSRGTRGRGAWDRIRFGNGDPVDCCPDRGTDCRSFWRASLGTCHRNGRRRRGGTPLFVGDQLLHHSGGLSHASCSARAPGSNLADALALLASKDKSGAGFEYGWVRGAGSAAFIVGSIIAGVAISVYGLAVILWLQAACLMAVPWAARLLPPAMAPSRDAAKHHVRGRILSLAKSPSFRRVVLAAALILGSHAMHDTFAMIRWRAAGISPWQTSLLWSVAVAAEVIVFFAIGPRLVGYLTAPGSIALAAVCGAIRWCVAAITPDIVAVALTQPLHGFTFALLHLACMQVIVRTVPRQLAADCPSHLRHCRHRHGDCGFDPAVGAGCMPTSARQPSSA